MPAQRGNILWWQEKSYVSVYATEFVMQVLRVYAYDQTNEIKTYFGIF